MSSTSTSSRCSRTRSLYFIAPGQAHYWNCEAPVQGRLAMFSEQLLLGATSETGRPVASSKM